MSDKPDKKKNDPNHPTVLSRKQRRQLDQLIEHFGAEHSKVKRGKTKPVAKALFGTQSVPSWITRNESVRCPILDEQGKIKRDADGEIVRERAFYDLSVLAKLPVIDDAAPVKKTEEKPAEKAPEKKPEAKKPAEKKKTEKKKPAPPKKEDKKVDAPAPEETPVAPEMPKEPKKKSPPKKKKAVAGATTAPAEPAEVTTESETKENE